MREAHIRDWCWNVRSFHIKFVACFSSTRTIFQKFLLIRGLNFVDAGLSHYVQDLNISDFGAPCSEYMLLHCIHSVLKIWLCSGTKTTWVGWGEDAALAWKTCSGAHKHGRRCSEVTLDTFSSTVLLKTPVFCLLFFITNKAGNRPKLSCKCIQWSHASINVKNTVVLFFQRYKHWNTVSNCCHWLRSLLVEL